MDPKSGQNAKTCKLKLMCASVGVALLIGVVTLASCGAGGTSSGRTPDFSISLSPSSVSTDVGTTTSPVTIAVSAQPGFTGSVDIALKGMPHGVTVSPSSSFSLAADASQAVTFSVADSATVGTSSITVLATGGTHTHSRQLTLTANALVNTYRIGSVLYLESGTAVDTARIGLDTNWGGSIVELSLNGTNFVNAHDTGREVQPSFYDGNAQYDNCAGCTLDWGWNPVLAGDGYNHGTPTISEQVNQDSLYTDAQPLQWIPDGKGGGPGTPVQGDVLVEQTVTALLSHAHTFQVHCKVTHLGTDLHADAQQEFPAVYVNSDYNRFIYYGGTHPWANEIVSVTQFQQLGDPGFLLYVPEHWGAHVNSQNVGLTVYVPSQYPYVSGFDSPGDGTNYFLPFSMLTFGPNFMFEGDFYVIGGDYAAARQIVYDLHRELGPAPDIFAPLGSTDAPSPGSTISGNTTVSGWAFGTANLTSVEVLVDKTADGTATYGSPRPDVGDTFFHAPANIGYSYSLDTTKYADGPHTLNVRVTDNNGNVAVFADVAVSVSNAVPGANLTAPRQANPPTHNPFARSRLEPSCR
jgi:Bacterial Ig domain